MLYGTDPEFFSVVYQDGNPYVISPGLLEVDGQIQSLNEDVKHPVFISTDNFNWMMDGVAWELTIKKPLKSYKEMHRTLNNAIDSLDNLISTLNWKGLPLSLYRRPVVNINPQEYLPHLNNQKIYQGFIFGCDPDEDAILPDYVCATIDVSTHPFRYGGGHLHFSGIDKLFFAPRLSVQLLAITVGNFVIANSPYLNLEKQRGQTYGRPGRFRQQEYKDGTLGIEYRTPSNTWTEFPLDKKEELFALAEKAGELVINEDIGESLIKEFLPLTVTAINSADSELASSILKEI